MSGAARRLLAQSPFSFGSTSSSITSRFQCLHSRRLSDAPRRRANEEIPDSASGPLTLALKPIPSGSNLESSQSRGSPPKSGTLGNLGKMLTINQAQRANAPREPFLSPSTSQVDERFTEPHHFHVYATKHNTHITLTRPNREPIISVSAGNIGFRKGARKHYDSAFQLASYVMGRIQEQGINQKIERLEVCLRGFGAGREAVTKAFLGNEGRYLRGKVVKVSDATRLKFGGTRSKKPRRLG